MGRPIFSKTLISPLNPEVTIVCPTAAAAFMAMSPARWASSLSWSALVFPPKPSRFKLGFTSASAAAVGGAIPKFLETLAVTSSLSGAKMAEVTMSSCARNCSHEAFLSLLYPV